jgi:hypothetical protein
MKRKNNFTDSSVSFEDYEQAILAQPTNTSPVDELVKDRLSAEKESRRKESELKRA